MRVRREPYMPRRVSFLVAFLRWTDVMADGLERGGRRSTVGRAGSPSSATSPEWIVRRRPHRRSTRLHLGAALAGRVLAPVMAGDAPRLTMRQPDDARRTLASGTLALLLHGGVILGLLAVTWLHPEIVEEVIPVQLLPGAIEPPAPAPRMVQPQQLVNAAVAPAVVAPAAPQTLAPAEVPNVRMSRIEPMVAPARIQRRDVDAGHVAAVQSADVPQVAPLDVSRIAPSQLRPSSIALPDAPVAGPRRIEAGASVQAARVADGASQAFARAGQTREYVSQATSGGAPVPSSGSGHDFAVDTGVAAAYVGGEGAGGTGTAVGTVSCLKSAYVLDYLAQVKDRTYRRWSVPEGVPANRTVRLRFTLDAAGTARDLEIVSAGNAALGQSALEALQAASPFPPMDDAVRCLAGERLIGTFTVPR